MQTRDINSFNLYCLDVKYWRGKGCQKKGGGPIHSCLTLIFDDIIIMINNHTLRHTKHSS